MIGNDEEEFSILENPACHVFNLCKGDL